MRPPSCHPPLAEKNLVFSTLQPAVLPVPGGGEGGALAEAHLGLPAQVAADLLVGADPVALSHLDHLVAGEGDGLAAQAAVELADEGGSGEGPGRRGQAQRLPAHGLLNSRQEVAPRVDGAVVQGGGGGGALGWARLAVLAGAVGGEAGYEDEAAERPSRVQGGQKVRRAPSVDRLDLRG